MINIDRPYLRPYNSAEEYFGNVMKKELIDILACPICKSELTLSIEEEDKQEVITGSLHCAKCSEDYPIKDTIPNLLPPDTRK